MEGDGVGPVEGAMRWTARRKADLVLDLLKGARQIHEVCRENDLKQSIVERWIRDFVETGTRGLKARGTDEEAVRAAEIKELQAKIGELVLHNAALKKSHELWLRQQEEERESCSEPSKKS